MARLTGLEPATPGVTGRYSNQLSYNRPLRAGEPAWGAFYEPGPEASSGFGQDRGNGGGNGGR